MKEMNDVEIKKIQLMILKKTVDFCKKENLKYFLGYGTLLGAIRHKGYIPWDDDIDLIMPRNDYEKLIYKFNDEEKNYKIYNYQIDTDYIYPFAKVSYEGSILIENNDAHFKKMGVNIDVFPLDGFDDKEKINFKTIKRVKRLKNIMLFKLVPLNLKRPLIRTIALMLGKILFAPIKYIKLIRKIDFYAKKYKYNESNFVGCIVWNYGRKEIMDKEVFKDFTYVEFEGSKYQAPIKYHEYLTKLYGDYLKLPPVKDRKSHHSSKSFWKS